MSRQIRVSDETAERLIKFADGRTMDRAVSMLLDIQERQVVGTAMGSANAGETVEVRLDGPGADQVLQKHFDQHHQFMPQKGNSLRCEHCGRPKGKH